jgi:hypothetical protein
MLYRGLNGQGIFWGLKINERSHASRFNISNTYPNIFDLLETDGDIADNAIVYPIA